VVCHDGTASKTNEVLRIKGIDAARDRSSCCAEEKGVSTARHHLPRICEEWLGTTASKSYEC